MTKQKIRPLERTKAEKLAQTQKASKLLAERHCARASGTSHQPNSASLPGSDDPREKSNAGYESRKSRIKADQKARCPAKREDDLETQTAQVYEAISHRGAGSNSCDNPDSDPVRPVCSPDRKRARLDHRSPVSHPRLMAAEPPATISQTDTPMSKSTHASPAGAAVDSTALSYL